MAAIRIAASRPEQVSKVTLISAAAPLQMGSFLPDMAGQAIFQLALHRPGLLGVVTGLQSRLTRVSPHLMTRLLFGTCGASERALLKDPAFRDAIHEALRSCFITHRQAYLAYVRAYVADWSGLLAQVQCPVELWHGTADMWAPPDMAVALKSRFGAACVLHQIEDGEHYSTMCQTRLTPV
jgi:Predicted hydrolases or acyltransferases (alpha/beta hydrolase superfamily)